MGPARRPPIPLPAERPGGPFRPERWRSPLRGPWLASFLGSALLPLIAICAITGFLSDTAYNPAIGGNSPNPDAIQIPGFRWVEPAVPASPAAPVHPNLFGMQGYAAAVLARINARG